MTGKHRVYSTACLVEILLKQDDYAQDYPEFFSPNGDLRPDVDRSAYWRSSWPDHCVTCSHIGDATIDGPYQDYDSAEAG